MSFVHLFDFARSRQANGSFKPPVRGDIAPSVHAFAKFLNISAGIPDYSVVSFNRPLSRISDWANAQLQCTGENSLSFALMVTFAEELFEDIGRTLELEAARSLPSYDVKETIRKLSHTIERGDKGFHLIKYAGHDYQRQQEAWREFEDRELAAQVRRGSSAAHRDDEHSSPDSTEPPAKKLPKPNKLFCPHYAAGLLNVESGNREPIQCTRSSCHYPHPGLKVLQQQIRGDKDKAKTLFFEVFTNSGIRQRLEAAIKKI